MWVRQDYNPEQEWYDLTCLDESYLVQEAEVLDYPWDHDYTYEYIYFTFIVRGRKCFDWICINGSNKDTLYEEGLYSR